MYIRLRRVAVTGCALALLTGCAQNGNASKVASISSATTTAAASTTASDEDQALAYVRCMREHGIAMPDPKTDGGGIGVTIPDGADRSKVDAATEACKSLMPNGGASKPVSAEDLDKLRQVAKCLREHGVDVPDPTAADPGIKVEANGANKDKIDAAMRACNSLRPAGPGGTVNNEAGG
jgi:hypothetical protein